MKKLDAVFPESQHLQISDLVDAIGGKKSELSRAALYLGLQQIKELAARDKGAAQELVAITDFKVRQ